MLWQQEEEEHGAEVDDELEDSATQLSRTVPPHLLLEQQEQHDELARSFAVPSRREFRF